MKGLSRKQFKNKALTDIFKITDYLASGISMMTPFLKEYIKRSGATASDLVGATNFNPDTTKINEWIDNRSNFVSESFNNTNRDIVLSKVKDGIDNNKTLTEIIGDVKDVYEDINNSNVIRIVRTETSAANNFGSTQAYLQAGITKHEWMVVDPTDEDCLENEGVVVSIGEEFPDGSIDPPDPHPNCECTTLPVFEDENEE